MNEKLQTALMLLLRAQDRDTVNNCFDLAFCDGSRYCRVDLQAGKLNIYDANTGEEVGFHKFNIAISECGLRITPGPVVPQGE